MFGSLNTGMILPPQIVERQSPSVATDFVLPSTGVKAGMVFWIINTSTATNGLLTIKSSDGDTVTLIRFGRAVLMANQDNPTDGTHWDLINVYESFDFATVFTFGGGAVTASKTLRITRNNRQATVSLPNSCNVVATAATGTATSAALEARFWPINTCHTWAFVRDNGTNTAGEIHVNQGSGIVTILKAVNGTFAGGLGGNTGLENGVTVSYTTI